MSGAVAVVAAAVAAAAAFRLGRAAEARVRRRRNAAERAARRRGARLALEAHVLLDAAGHRRSRSEHPRRPPRIRLAPGGTA